MTMNRECPQCHSRFVAGPFLIGLNGAVVAFLFAFVFLIIFFPIALILAVVGVGCTAISVFSFLPSVKNKVCYACFRCKHKWKPIA